MVRAKRSAHVVIGAKITRIQELMDNILQRQLQNAGLEGEFGSKKFNFSEWELGFNAMTNTYEELEY
ncbi:hypothetical protein Bca4012_095990 [Brassica carinata]|uniref:Uncharacterized protein n=2 Tax=Brassica oleracea TaxID=3712 RepID=A0A0D3DVA8_BRAOL|nr:unnamed protein product [Brassica oleracea]